MRRTFQLFVAVKPGRFLEPHTPTGLTGLLTHNSPRPTLKYLYQSTLEQLSQFPPHSLYRQSIKALTKHRLSIVDSVEPEGYQEWKERTSRVIAEAGHIQEGQALVFGKGKQRIELKGGQIYVTNKVQPEQDPNTTEWDNERIISFPEGRRSSEMQERHLNELRKQRDNMDTSVLDLKEEPPLSVDQISEVEEKIGAGLIEEVIQVAEGEMKLAGVLLKARVWEDLEEKPAEGQWTYFDRDAHTKGQP